MTKEYYNLNAHSFIENTLNVDMSEQYQLFEKYLPKKAKILDIGFGSGRDSVYFSKNYEVVSIDNCEAFIEEGKKIIQNPIIFMDVTNMDFDNEFEGIWACATLLHIPFDDLAQVFNKCYKALKPNGIMYASFKYGTYEGKRNGRYFTDLDEERLASLLSKTQFKMIDTIITQDVRPERNENWLNVILGK